MKYFFIHLEGAEHTADFCEKFDQLFNAFNSRGHDSSAKMAHPMSSESGHKEFLRKMLPWVQSIKSKGIHRLFVIFLMNIGKLFLSTVPCLGQGTKAVALH